jgi:hypothetical protein
MGLPFKPEDILKAARELPAEDLPVLIGQLETAKAMAWARLTAPTQQTEHDELVDVTEAARRLGVSTDCLSRRDIAVRLEFADFGRSVDLGSRCTVMRGHRLVLVSLLIEKTAMRVFFVAAERVTVKRFCATVMMVRDRAMHVANRLV